MSLVVNIKEAFEMVRLLNLPKQVSPFLTSTRGNYQGPSTYDYPSVAGENSGAVIGTDHAAENLRAFFPIKFGDGGADILPLSLNKASRCSPSYRTLCG